MDSWAGVWLVYEISLGSPICRACQEAECTRVHIGWPLTWQQGCELSKMWVTAGYGAFGRRIKSSKPAEATFDLGQNRAKQLKLKKNSGHTELEMKHTKHQTGRPLSGIHTMKAIGESRTKS